MSKKETPEFIEEIRKGNFSESEAITEIFKNANIDINNYPVDIWEIARSFKFDIFEANFKNPAISGLMYDGDETLKILEERNPDSKRVIILNRNENRAGQSFTIAHEVAHFAYDVDANSNFYEAYHVTKDELKRKDGLTGQDIKNKVREDKADAFAAKLLMPENIFRELVDASLVRNNRDKLAKQLALAFMTTEEAIIRRFTELNIQFN